MATAEKSRTSRRTTLGRLIQILLKSDERIPDNRHIAQLINRIRYRVVFQDEQTSQFFLIEFFDALLNVLRQNEIKKLLQLFIVPLKYFALMCDDTFCTCSPGTFTPENLLFAAGPQVPVRG